MNSRREAFIQMLAELEDDVATARAALDYNDYRAIAEMPFRDTFRRCLTQHYTEDPEAARQTVVGTCHLLESYYLPAQDDDAIVACLDEFQAILDDLRRWNRPILPASESLSQ